MELQPEIAAREIDGSCNSIPHRQEPIGTHDKFWKMYLISTSIATVIALISRQI